MENLNIGNVIYICENSGDNHISIRKEIITDVTEYDVFIGDKNNERFFKIKEEYETTWVMDFACAWGRDASKCWDSMKQFLCKKMMKKAQYYMKEAQKILEEPLP